MGDKQTASEQTDMAQFARERPKKVRLGGYWRVDASERRGRQRRLDLFERWHLA